MDIRITDTYTCIFCMQYRKLKRQNNMEWEYIIKRMFTRVELKSALIEQ